MGGNMVKWLASNAEDVALSLGTLCVSVGVGLRFDASVGLIVFGALLVAYGVWITGRRS